jgi:hypothetical protein
MRNNLIIFTIFGRPSKAHDWPTFWNYRLIGKSWKEILVSAPEVNQKITGVFIYWSSFMLLPEEMFRCWLKLTCCFHRIKSLIANGNAVRNLINRRLLKLQIKVKESFQYRWNLHWAIFSATMTVFYLNKQQAATSITKPFKTKFYTSSVCILNS